ncbi:MAG: hypothetical protein IPM37_18720 [Hahellaceae bacterium]|nr:hypothetical protein [Hahellaceae bacterium]
MGSFALLLAFWLALASAETLHGILRAALLVPRVGKKRALKISIVTGSLLAFGVSTYFVPKFGTSNTWDLLGLGLATSFFLASFDVALAYWVLRRPLLRCFEDFNPASGNYLSIGLFCLVFFPLVVMWLQG